jgi:hypothetical protein
LTFGNVDAAGRRLEGLTFRPLPARPMVDVHLDGGVKTGNVESFLRRRIAELDTNSIVRIKCKDGGGDALKRRLTGSFFRSVFPPTMNYQLSGDFFRPRRSAPKC